MSGPVVAVSGLTKQFPTSSGPLEVIRSADLTVHRTELVAIMGRSGSGKSTLLNLLGLLDTPTSGVYLLDGRNVSTGKERHRDAIRRDAIGFVFQSSHILGKRTVSQNVDLKLAIAQVPIAQRSTATGHALTLVGLEDRADALGQTLSGGEKQRLAIARAIVVRPTLLLADEPTGNLDPANASAVMLLLRRAASAGTAVVVITHDVAVARTADRAMLLESGQLHEVGLRAL